MKTDGHCTCNRGKLLSSAGGEEGGRGRGTTVILENWKAGKPVEVNYLLHKISPILLRFERTQWWSVIILGSWGYLVWKAPRFRSIVCIVEDTIIDTEEKYRLISTQEFLLISTVDVPYLDYEIISNIQQCFNSKDRISADKCIIDNHGVRLRTPILPLFRVIVKIKPSNFYS